MKKIDKKPVLTLLVLLFYAIMPAQDFNSQKIVSVSAGVVHTLAIDAEGNLWVWGSNHFGQLGDGTTNDKSSPVPIKSGTHFQSVAAGEIYSLAIDTGGNLWAWGNNNYGNLGDGTTTNRKSLVQIKPGTHFKSVAGGTAHSLAVDTDGNFWAWGHNEYGKLGNGNNDIWYSSVPIWINTGNVSVKETKAGGLKAYGIAGGLKVESETLESYALYNMAGIKIGAGTVEAGETLITLPQGFYIFSTGKSAVKAVVK